MPKTINEDYPNQRLLDPEGFYSSRVDKLAKDAEPGLELLAYNLFGKQNIKSLAFALDPLSAFKLSKQQVSPANRYRTFPVTRGFARFKRKRTKVYSISTSPDTSTPYLWDNKPTQTELYSDDTATSALASQQALYGYVRDSTWRTRPMDIDFGEFELFKPSIISKDRSYSVQKTYNRAIVTTPWVPNSDVQGNDTYVQATTIGSAARLLQSSLNSISAVEKTLAENLIADQAYAMVSRTMPLSRSFSAFRSVAELKDLPRSLYSLATAHMRGFKDLDKKSNAYLEWQFGWAPILSDIIKLLKTPEIVSKRINRLIDRQGQPTTFRSGYSYLESISAPPGFVFDVIGDESVPASITTHSGQRKVELRCVVNATVKFPKLAQPTLRTDLFNRLMGVRPNPLDFYNLVPWTWLIDWFTGMGDYVNVMSSLNDDPSVINYGFLTYESHGEITSEYRNRVTKTRYLRVDGQLREDSSEQANTSGSAKLRYKFIRRKSIANADNVKTSWDLPTLSSFQASIAAALLYVNRPRERTAFNNRSPFVKGYRSIADSWRD